MLLLPNAAAPVAATDAAPVVAATDDATDDATMFQAVLSDDDSCVRCENT